MKGERLCAIAHGDVDLPPLYEKGLAQSGYRLISNTGRDANQTVFHLHMHCLGGKKLPQTS